MTLKTHNFTVMLNDMTVPISYDTVATLISDSIHFLGWIKVEHTESPKSITYKYAPGELKYPDYPLNGGSLILKVKGDENLFRLDLNTIERGLVKLCKEQPGYANEILDENTDNETASLFFEYCLYGEPIFD